MSIIQFMNLISVHFWTYLDYDYDYDYDYANGYDFDLLLLYVTNERMGQKQCFISCITTNVSQIVHGVYRKAITERVWANSVFAPLYLPASASTNVCLQCVTTQK